MPCAMELKELDKTQTTETWIPQKTNSGAYVTNLISQNQCGGCGVSYSAKTFVITAITPFVVEVK